MDSPDSIHNDFIKKLSEVAEANLTNPQFGVSMLAKEMGMSRSNLHRKVNSKLKISVSQFINHVRLKKAREILRHTSRSVSEIAYEVGFNNVSYFIKCFHEYYGYSPRQIGERDSEENDSGTAIHPKTKKLKTILIPSIFVFVLAIVLVLIFKPFLFQQEKPENTVTILPPWGEIRDTSYLTDIDGIVINVIDNLGKIQDIKITPWLSVLQYRNMIKPAPEIAKERKTNYLIQPRVRSLQNKIILSLNLIEGPEDKFLETFVHEIDSNNILTIHQKIIKEITEKLDISISPAEQMNINKLITSNKKALNYYWKGTEILNLYRNNRKADLKEAKNYFEKVLELDNECASAYAQIAIIYYYMDFQRSDHTTRNHEILYRKEITRYADKAMLYDSRLDLSLIAKALYYRNEKEYEMAITYLENALKYNPHSYLAISNLHTLYEFTENSEKSLEVALQIINSGLPVKSTDTELGIEQIYFQLSTAYRRLGFFDKALYYINEAIRRNPDYTFALFTKSQIIMDLDEEDSYKQSIEYLEDIMKQDSAITGYYFLGQSYYMLRDYPKAYSIYKKWFEISGNSVADYTGLASGRLAVIFKELGESQNAQMQINNYRVFGESKDSDLSSFILTGYYSFTGDTTKALEQLKITSQYNHVYNHILKLKDAPLYDSLRDLPKFQQILSEMESRWYARRDSIKVVFENKGLL